ncbi:MAG: alpha-glucosidase C-terminal domain-containing protein [Candidatus Eisenbacteria bacterium]|nr:alpha-glucosidase C-terminal domain-containing protein [Candidatus Eisenbacteria bacterium]
MRPLSLTIALVLLLAAGAAAQVDVPFAFDPSEANPRSVSVAGEWNDWNPGADILSDPDGDGVYETTLSLAPGRYEYKFVVDGQWYPDPNAAESTPDPYGGNNSVLTVGGEKIAGVSYRIGPPRPAEGSEIREVPFRFRPDRTPSQVFLAGTFNEWNSSADRMEGPDDDGAFHLKLALAPGEYQYKFVADGSWHHDPDNDRTTDDGYGGFNSLIAVDDRFPTLSMEKGDGEIRGEGLALDMENLRVVRMEPDLLTVTARAYQGDVEGAELLFRSRGEEEVLPMREVGGDGRYVYFRAELHAPPETEGRLGVLLRDGDRRAFLTRGGLADSAEDASLLEVNAVSTPLFHVPDWVVDGVFYQIFPDRFRNGNKKNDPDFSEPYYRGKTSLGDNGKSNDEYYHLVKDWNDYAGLRTSPYRTDGKPDWFSFYGGDLEGVTEKLDYLKDLGVTILYFNPLHKAKSNHKYDACDYRAVDPHFGGDDAFRRMTEKAHEMGIRVVVDGVFNHTGNCHYAFVDCVEKGDQSSYWNWYEWKKWPLPERFDETHKPIDYYDCWWGFGDLPNLNFDLSRPNPSEQSARRIGEARPNQPVVDEVLAAVRFWMGDMGADGFRLDVPNECPAWLWKLFREEARRVNPDGYVVAELWGDAAADLSPLQFDATMNYKYYREPALGFFARGSLDASVFDLQLAGGRYAYPLPSVLGAMNLLGSHDTERFLTLAAGDQRRLLLAYLFGATYVGVPHVYYGDEIGMEGGKDPDCRRPFHWDELEVPARKAVHEEIRKYFALRHDHDALRRGEFRTLHAEGSLFAYSRWMDEDRLAVLLNAGHAPAEIVLERAALPFPAGEATDLLSGQSFRFDGDLLTIRLEPFAGAVLHFPAAPGSD